MQHYKYLGWWMDVSKLTTRQMEIITYLPGMAWQVVIPYLIFVFPYFNDRIQKIDLLLICEMKMNQVDPKNYAGPCCA